MNRSIFFGFYNGLGDLISDLVWIRRFVDEGYDLTISVSSWLESLTRFLVPESDIIMAGLKEDISAHRYDYDLIFLTPNYLHPFSGNPRSIPAYISKYLQVKKRAPESAVILHPSMYELLGYMFGFSDNYLHRHFSMMSYGLLQKYAPLFSKTPAILAPPPEPSHEAYPEISELFIFPYSGNEAKNYPLEAYLQIAKQLQSTCPGLNSRFFVTPKEYEQTRKEITGFEVVTTSLENLCTLFGPRVLILCADSGPGHLGSYFKSHALILFGMTDSKKYAPKGEGKILTLQSPTPRVAEIPLQTVFEKITSSFTLPKKEERT